MPDYILEPIDTDPDVILEELIDYVQIYAPNWEPSEAQLDYLIARFVSLKMATIADMSSRVQRNVFMYFGDTMLNLPPKDATVAQVSTTWTAIDSLGHTLDAGTSFGIRDAEGELHEFLTDNTATITAGSTSVSGVIGTSTEAGVIVNGLSGPIEVLEQVDWALSANTDAPSSGALDGETEEDYLDRLANNLSLMAPRPILAKDYALIARNIDNVWRSAAIDNFLPGTNEVQTISHNYTGNGATGGTITWSGQTTAALAFNSTAAQVQTALEGLNNLEAGDIVATGGPWPAAITLTFKGRQEYTNVAQITASAGTWTGGTTITINTTTGGVAANTSADRAVAVSGLTAAGLGIDSTTKTALDTYLQSLREQNFVINVLDPAFTTVDVTTTVVKKSGADSADIQTRSVTAINDLLDSKQWGIPRFPEDGRGWERQTVLRAQEFYTVLNGVDGVDYVSALTFSNGASATQDGTDKTLSGTFPLPRAGTISVTVT